MQLLDKLIKALERGSNADKRSLWVHGAYGTGKTFAAFVVKHLLEDPLPDVREYFSHPLLKQYEKRFTSLREAGDYLVVYKSGSASVSSTLRLIAEVQRAIKSGLEMRGLQRGAPETLLESVLDKLENPASSFNWSKAFQNHREKFPEFASPDEVIERLKKGSPELLVLVADVLEKEGLILADNTEHTKQWIKHIIQSNQLRGVVFIWDEFTDFFSVNTALSDFQELAHLSSETPFYFILVTHRTPEQFKTIKPDDMRKIAERFVDVHLLLEPVTAYRLIGHALRVKQERREDWERLKNNLWSDVEHIVQPLLMDNQPDVFKDLTPIHPYSGWILTKIASQFSSSQRTLFRFLKGEEKNSVATFLAEYPKEAWRWLTPDKLWDYFFEEQPTEFAQTAQDIINHCRSRWDQIDNEIEGIVFKIVMLLTVLWRETSSLRPDDLNIKKMVWGCMKQQEVVELLNKLCEKGILNALPLGGDGLHEYVIPLIQFDKKKVKEIEEDFRREHPFESFAYYSPVRESGDLGRAVQEAFSPDELLANRQVRGVCLAKHLDRKQDSVIPALQAYQLGTVIVVPSCEEDIPLSETICRKLSGNHPNTAFLVIHKPFTERDYEQWVQNSVQSLYCNENNDSKNAQYYGNKAAALVKEWTLEAKSCQMTVCFQGTETRAVGNAGYMQSLREITDQIFPKSPEHISSLQTLYKLNQVNKVAAQIGLGAAAKTTKQYEELKARLEDFEACPESGSQVATILHEMCEAVASTAAPGGSLVLSEAWATLQQPPFGLYPSLIGAALFAFSLKKYSRNHYWWDGVNSLQLTQERLVDLVLHVVKNGQRASVYEIRSMSKDDETICSKVREIFGLPLAKTEFLDDARKAVRELLSSVGAPLWAVQYAPPPDHAGRDLLESALPQLDKFLLVGTSHDGGWTDDDSKKLAETLQEAATALKEFCGEGNYQKGIRGFLCECEPSLPSLLEQLGASYDDILGGLRRVMNEECWLWQREEVSAQIPSIIQECRFVYAIRYLCGARGFHTPQDAVAHVKDEWLTRSSTLPLFVYGALDGEVGGIFRQLDELWPNFSIHAHDLEMLVDRMVQHKEAIRQAVSGRAIEALKEWTRLHTGIDLGMEDARLLLDVVAANPRIDDPDLFRQKVATWYEELRSRKLCESLKDAWKTITGTDSPSDWSESRMTPVKWMVEGSEFRTTVDVAENPQKYALQEVEKALKWLQENEGILSELSDQAGSDSAFLRNVAFEFAEFVTDDKIQGLKGYIKEKLACPVHQWPDHVGAIKDLAMQWLTGNYQTDGFHKISTLIESWPAEKTRIVLKELVKDPSVGMRLLAMTAKEGGRSL
ncbi:MAG: hypothetical protein ACP5LD_15155 [Desulfomonilaceae bacterium]